MFQIVVLRTEVLQSQTHYIQVSFPRFTNYSIDSYFKNINVSVNDLRDLFKHR